MSIRLVIFDLDGVLINSKDVWFKAWQDSFRAAGRKLSLGEFNVGCWGNSFPAVCREKGMDDGDYEKAKEALIRSFLIHKEEIAVFNRVNALFSELESRKIKRALLSNNRRDVKNALLDKFGMEFDVSPDLYETDGLNPKPDPSGIYYILDKLGVSKDESVYIGDTEIDEVTGRNAGVRTLIVGRDISSITEVLNHI